jgi:UDP-N-acetylglucosamine diphosphorylase/glucosamine-1-phosphate N-acetyltransferase
MQKSSFNTAVVILAAGLGTRMKSNKAKVLHTVGGKPMIIHVVGTAASIVQDNIIVVTGHQSEQVRDIVRAHHADCGFAFQEKQLGTGHAVLCAMPEVHDEIENVLILCGDVPLLEPRTIYRFIQHHVEQKNVLTVLAVNVEEPTGYGRMIVNGQGALVKITEEADASVEEKKIKTVNSGIYCVDRAFLEDALKKLTPENAQQELYLTDIISIASDEMRKIGLYIGPDSDEVIGVNSLDDLAQAERILHRRLR